MTDKGFLHRIDFDLIETRGFSRWFIFEALRMRCEMDDLLAKHAEAARIYDDLYPETP